MAAATTESFLEGQGIRVDLPNIEAELANLWGPAAEQVGGPDVENPNVTRVVLANLVVECLDGGGESLGPVLETVMARFPCRAIVLCGSGDQDRRIAADVSALCHLPAPGLPQVCSERIVLRAGPSAIDLIPGAVRPLLETDLPLVLWWTGDPRRHEALFRDLADECSRLVLDLGDPGADAGALRLGLDRSLCACSRDSAWFGLGRWRELVAQFFDPHCHGNRLGQIISVQIEALSSNPTRPPRLAIWLAAWLAGQLGWQPHDRSLRNASDAAGGSELEARFSSPAGDIAVLITTKPFASNSSASTELIGVTITSRGSGASGEQFETFRLRRPAPGSPAVVIEAEATDLCRLPRAVEAPELDAARRVAATLEASRVDVPFDKALPIALWLLESADAESS
jgi:glucose-6-phosphate dehydrogenase assembly protein OpcA